MDNSSESDSHMLGLSVVEDSQNIAFEDGTSLGIKRLHLDSESSVDLEVSSLTGFVTSKRIKMENSCEDDVTSDLLTQASCDGLGDDMLGSTTSEGLSSAAFTTEDQNSNEDECVLIEHLNIKEPLCNLKKSLEQAHGIDLEGYEFFLQDATALDGNKNLVEQCVQGIGTVQINLQLKIENDGTKKINILDVLKPSDAYLLATGNPAFRSAADEQCQPPQEDQDHDQDQDQVNTETQQKEKAEDVDNPIRWTVDFNFKANQQRLGIPQDPKEWEVSHVRHWLLWAVRQFNLTGIKLADWKLTGVQLCNLSLQAFKDRVPYDPCDIFWTHLELLRRCHFVAVMQNPEEVLKSKENKPELDKNIMRNRARPHVVKPQPVLVDSMNLSPITSAPTWTSNRGGHHGQVQLWQFLLDLLTDKNHRECIQWLGAEGEFKLIEPETVAQLWGQRKNKPSMNYEKLSRALRYYYDGDMIAKVHGKRFVYKFVCDLKQLLGYSAFELNRLVIEAEMRATNVANDPIQNSIFGNGPSSPLT